MSLLTILPRRGGGNPTAAGLLTSLVAFWKLDEASGVRDDAVGANNLTDNNTVTQAAGTVGNAAQFTAANSEYLSIADNADLSTGDIDFTVTAWVYLDSKGANRTIASKASFGIEEWLLRYSSANDRFEFYILDSTPAFRVATANTLGVPATATWYFIVAWHDATANTVSIQVNDGTADSGAAGSGGPADRAGAFGIGAYGDGTAATFHDGRVDAAGFWKRTLTATEKTYLYNGGSGREYPFT